MENEQPTAGNYGGFVNKLYLIQPQASQINVRHVGSSTYGNHYQLLRSEVFRKLTKFTDEKVLDWAANLFSLKWRGAGRNGCIRRLFLEYAVKSRPLPSEKIGEKPLLRFFPEERGWLYTGTSNLRDAGQIARLVKSFSSKFS